MQSPNDGFSSIDAYIATFPQEIQAILEALRATIRTAAPDAEEKISYQMPTFAQKGNLVYFAALKEPYWLLSHSKRDCSISTGIISI